MGSTVRTRFALLAAVLQVTLALVLPYGGMHRLVVVVVVGILGVIVVSTVNLLFMCPV